MPDVRFVIPQGVDPDAQAWPQRSETWRELSTQLHGGIVIEYSDSLWCAEHGIGGLGFCAASADDTPESE